MSTVTKPIALDESLNTTESPSRNIADVLAEELSGIASAISNGAYDELSKLEDVNISTPINGEVLKYNSTSQKWENGTGGGGGGDTVTWTQIQSGGTKIAEIDINGTSTDVYAPSGGSGTVSLIVTCASAYQGETLTLTKGATTLTQTVPAGLEVTFSVPSLGTWVLSNTLNTTTVTITMDYYGQYFATLSAVPDGSTITPTDDVETLLHCANIWDKAYSTISELLADTTSLSAVISSNNAVDYLARSTTWASTICADSTAMSYIGLNNYCANTLINDSTWRTAIIGSSYKSSVENVSVPTMTDNTHPSGEVGAIGASMNASTAWKAFDGNSSTAVAKTDDTTINNIIYYDFGSAVTIIEFDFKSANGNPQKFKAVYSDDKSTWTECSGEVNTGSSLQSGLPITDVSSHRYWGMKQTYSGGGAGSICDIIQFYGREDV